VGECGRRWFVVGSFMKFRRKRFGFGGNFLICSVG